MEYINDGNFTMADVQRARNKIASVEYEEEKPEN
jgi:hypothetical protein